MTSLQMLVISAVSDKLKLVKLISDPCATTLFF